jgi:hypothetical protein
VTRVVGVDFPGNDKMWRPRCGRSNVWLATVERVEATPRLEALQRVQELAGDGHPFRRLCAYLKAPGLTAVAIDAPFSLPTRFLPQAGWHGLLQSVKSMPVGTRPFPRGQALVDAAAAVCDLDEPKPLRATERLWRDSGLNVRSTLWNGPRGGAPFTAACLRLIAESGLPAWPWSPVGKAILVEAFPAAQLLTWGLPSRGYDNDLATRLAILDRLGAHLTMPPPLRDKAAASADALDAVLCTFAATAVIEDRLACPLPSNNGEEGWIAVHS